MRLRGSSESFEERVFHLFHLFHLHRFMTYSLFQIPTQMMVMVEMMTVSHMSSMDLRLIGRRHFRATGSELTSRGAPPVLLVSPALHTVRDMLISTPTSTTMVGQVLLLILAGLVLVVLVADTMPTGTTFSRIVIDFSSFLLFFWYLMPKGRK
jgi:hypothetical protein